jgi:hypothetical protein
MTNNTINTLKTIGQVLAGTWVGSFALLGIYRGAKKGYDNSLYDYCVINESCVPLKYSKIGVVIVGTAIVEGYIEALCATLAPVTVPIGYIATKLANKPEE